MSNQTNVNDVDMPTGAKLCSMCGLCMVDEWKSKESIQSCVFSLGWLGKQEVKVFGRERSQDNLDEMLFGISRKRFNARMKKPLPRTQFTGIITSIAHKAFETHLIRNYYFVKQNYPELLPTLVPKYAYRILEEYELKP
jgi:coenzyme F420 hydrogenase subunit beta